MPLVLSTPTNPGVASWVPMSGAAGAFDVVNLPTSTQTTVSYLNSTSVSVANGATPGSETTLAVAAPTFAGQELTFYLRATGGGSATLNFASQVDNSGTTSLILTSVGDCCGLLAINTGSGGLAYKLDFLHVAGS